MFSRKVNFSNSTNLGTHLHRKHWGIQRGISPCNALRAAYGGCAFARQLRGWCERGIRPDVPCHHIREYYYAFGAVECEFCPINATQNHSRSPEYGLVELQIFHACLWRTDRFPRTRSLFRQCGIQRNRRIPVYVIGIRRFLFYQLNSFFSRSTSSWASRLRL